MDKKRVNKRFKNVIKVVLDNNYYFYVRETLLRISTSIKSDFDKNLV